MGEQTFFRPGQGLTLAEIATLTRSELRRVVNADRRISGIAAIDRAGPADLVFLDNAKFAHHAAITDAGACLCNERMTDRVSGRVALLVASDPYRAFVDAARALFPGALRPSSLYEASGTAPGAFVHPSARLENDVTIDPAAVIGPRVEIGSGTIIGAGAAVGAGVRIG